MIREAKGNSLAIQNSNAQIETFQVDFSPEMFHLITDNIYKNPIKAIIRELSCNAWDSHTEAKSEKPFHVHLPTQLDNEFFIRDYGTGLTPEQIRSVYTVLFRSTKTKTNDFTGCFGIGSKSPFALVDQFYVESFIGGKKWSYMVFKDESGLPSFIQVSEDDTEEDDGLKVGFAIDKDLHLWKYEAYDVLSSFPKESFTCNIENVAKINIKENLKTILEIGDCKFSRLEMPDDVSFRNGSWRWPDINGVDNPNYVFASILSSRKNCSILMGNILYPFPKELKNGSIIKYVASTMGSLILEVPIGTFNPTAGRDELQESEFLDKILAEFSDKFLEEAWADFTKVINTMTPFEMITFFRYMNFSSVYKPLEFLEKAIPVVRDSLKNQKLSFKEIDIVVAMILEKAYDKSSYMKNIQEKADEYFSNGKWPNINDFEKTFKVSFAKDISDPNKIKDDHDYEGITRRLSIQTHYGWSEEIPKKKFITLSEDSTKRFFKRNTIVKKLENSISYSNTKESGIDYARGSKKSFERINSVFGGFKNCEFNSDRKVVINGVEITIANFISNESYDDIYRIFCNSALSQERKDKPFDFVEQDELSKATKRIETLKKSKKVYKYDHDTMYKVSDLEYDRKYPGSYYVVHSYTAKKINSENFNIDYLDFYLRCNYFKADLFFVDPEQEKDFNEEHPEVRPWSELVDELDKIRESADLGVDFSESEIRNILYDSHNRIVYNRDVDFVVDLGLFPKLEKIWETAKKKAPVGYVAVPYKKDWSHKIGTWERNLNEQSERFFEILGDEGEKLKSLLRVLGSAYNLNEKIEEFFRQVPIDKFAEYLANKDSI